MAGGTNMAEGTSMAVAEEERVSGHVDHTFSSLEGTTTHGTMAASRGGEKSVSGSEKDSSKPRDLLFFMRDRKSQTELTQVNNMI